MDSLTPFVIARADPRDARVQTLIDRHLDLMRATSPPESVFAQDAEGLVRDGAHLFAAAEPEAPSAPLLGIGAFKMIGTGHAELKSMHVAAEARGRGAGRALLERILAEAKAMGATRASIETGSAAAFAPALALYRAYAFKPCPPFGSYVENPFSVFLSRDL
ncbi:MAG: GNAT family N-acetyltransferase [Pseudomonadota bacterium]